MPVIPELRTQSQKDHKTVEWIPGDKTISTKKEGAGQEKGWKEKKEGKEGGGEEEGTEKGRGEEGRMERREISTHHQLLNYVVSK